MCSLTLANISKHVSRRFTCYLAASRIFLYTLHLLCFQIPPDVWCYYNKHLMRYFELLHSSRIICLPLSVSEKLHWQHLFKKIGEADTHHLHVSTMQYPHTLKNSIYLSKNRGPPPFFHSDTNPVPILYQSFY